MRLAWVSGLTAVTVRWMNAYQLVAARTSNIACARGSAAMAAARSSGTCADRRTVVRALPASVGPRRLNRRAAGGAHARLPARAARCWRRCARTMCCGPPLCPALQRADVVALGWLLVDPAQAQYLVDGGGLGRRRQTPPSRRSTSRTREQACCSSSHAPSRQCPVTSSSGSACTAGTSTFSDPCC
jgi:hypothetical protein